MITVNYVLDGNSFLACADGYRYTMFITSTDEEYWALLETEVTYVDIGWNIDASQVADVDRAVGIRKRCRNDGALEF